MKSVIFPLIQKNQLLIF